MASQLSAKIKMDNGDFGERKGDLPTAPVLWLSAGDYDDVMKGLYYAIHVRAGSSEPTTQLGVRIISSRAMPSSVALLLPSHLNSMRPLLLNTNTFRERDVDRKLYRLTEYVTGKGIVLVTLES